MRRKLKQLGMVGGVVKAEVNERTKEKIVGLAHAKVVNDGGTADEVFCC